MRRSSFSVERRAGLSREDFAAQYLEPGVPVILTDQTRDWPATTTWTLDELARRYGDRPIRAYVHPEGLYTAWIRYRLDSTFGAVVASTTPNLFGSWDVVTEAPYLVDDIRIPAVLDPASVAEDATVWVQPHGHRTGLHWDTYHSVISVIRGEKRVLLFEPRYIDELYPCDVTGAKDLTRASWSKVDIFAPDDAAFPALRDVEYTELRLREGETLNIPRHWWHAVENLGHPTLAVSFFVRPQPRPKPRFFAEREVIAGLALRAGLAGNP